MGRAARSPYVRWMSTSASLDSTSVQLEAGEQVVIPLQIRNNGEDVEAYEFEVVGPAADWATVEPVPPVFPGGETTATLTFHPPRAPEVAAGELEFGVIVTPTQHPDETVVPEGVIEVLPFFETTAELVPRTSQGRLRARHKVAVDNRGNVPVTALLTGDDATSQLGFKVDPQGLTVMPGEALFANVRVKPAKRIWRGAPVTHPFTMEVAPQDNTSAVLDGTYVQQPILPSWLGKALLALLMLLAVLAAIWFFVLKPTIETAAEDAVSPQVEKAADQAATAEKQAAAAEDAAGSAQGAADEADTSAKKAQEIAGGPVPPKVVTRALSERLNAVTNEGATSPSPTQSRPSHD